MKEEGKYTKWIILIAVILPVAVAVLYFLPKGDGSSEMIKSIPFFNAIFNGASFLSLIFGLVAIRNGNKVVHRGFMMGAMAVSALFLVGYVIYHSQVPSTPFGGEGMVKWIYFTILITHIILAAGLAPLVLITFTRAIQGDFERHKKIAKWTYPIWLYVSLTGIIVYLMIEPYY